MARSLTEIQQSILNAKAQASTLNALQVLTTAEQNLSAANSTSKVAIWRLWVWIISYVIYIHEQIIEKFAENSRPHTINWYKNQCLNFLDGLPLMWLNEQFQYDLTNVIDADVRKIIDRCAILESNSGELVLKLATNNNGNVEPLTNAQLLRFTYYINQIKDAGNRIRILNQEADQLKIGLTVYVDPLIIDLQTGALLSGAPGVFPVKKAIDNYLEKLEFNGAFVRTFFQDELQKAPGVVLPKVDVLESQYLGFAFVPIVDWAIPEAGYFKVNPADLTITYLPNELG